MPTAAPTTTPGTTAGSWTWDWQACAKLNGKTVRVYVHGDFVAGMHVRFGRAHLHRRSGVPVVRRGSTVSARTTGGTLVAGGTFRRGCCRHHM